MNTHSSLNKIYDSIQEAFREGSMSQTLARKTIRHEVLGASFVLTSPTRNFLYGTERCMSPMYAAGELLWYLSGSADGGQICAYAPSYKRFLEADGTANGAYGPRFMPHFETTSRLLLEDPGTCRAYVPIFHPSDVTLARPHNDCNDVPCTTGVGFTRDNDGSLNMIVQMRSNDIWLGLPYDVYCWSSIGMLMAESIGTYLDSYLHQATSLHVYNNKAESLAELRRENIDSMDTDFYRPMNVHPTDDIQELILEAVGMERHLRELTSDGTDLAHFDTRQLESEIIERFGVDTVLGRNLILCMLNFFTELSQPNFERLRKYVPAAQLVNTHQLLQLRKERNAPNN